MDPPPSDIAPSSGNDVRPRIARHRTALHRTEHSLPVKCLLRDGLLSQAHTLFDYGCGRGKDLKLLREQGIAANGWDPAFNADEVRQPADVVNLGYVINVIEDPRERAETLRQAWSLSGKVLAVAAQIVVQGRGSATVPFGDGVVTRLGTFQKYFSQEELRTYIETELATDAVPAAPGVFFVFKDETARQEWMARRYRRRSAAPKKRLSERRFKEKLTILEPLMDAVALLGRLPEPDELPAFDALTAEFGSINRAFALVRRVTGDDAWTSITSRKTEDLLVYLALGRFQRRPPIGKLPICLQRDIRALFGNYTKACEAADDLLFRAGDPEAVSRACADSAIGKILPDALYLHTSALDYLSPLLRVYEGCARAYIGDVADATVVKLHRHSGKVSYLAYTRFEEDPHPALLRGVKVALRSRDVSCYDYAESDNPPVLHRKDAFVHHDHPLHAKFARLTEQEERHGLLDETAYIGTKNGWNRRLAERGFQLRGHRVIKQSQN
jgi:DNA phosphorothioation-associated putative methyltransferase